MTVDPSVVPGLLFLLAELVALAGVGYVIVRVALREADQRVALAQGLVVGPAIWGVVVNLVMYALPGMPGAVAGWIFVLALAAILVWRAPKPVRPRLRIAAGLTLIALALFWIALASRQLLTIPDAAIHLGMSASIRAGGFPPEIPWDPGTPAPYHYGSNLLRGLLAPPSGPDLAFVEELLGAYAWMCLVLVTITALWRRASGFAALVTAPLLLTAGAWTLTGSPDSILEILVPAGIPSTGIRASLKEIYWPSVELWNSQSHALPNIWKPSFTLSYSLAFVVLARATHSGRRSWLTVITLAALVGFLGLTSTSLAPIVFVLWAGLEAIHLMKSRRAGSSMRSALVLAASGLALAALLLVAANAYLIRILTDSVPLQGLSLGWNEHLGGWRLLGAFDRLPGGVGILGLGPLAVAAAAALLARRNRLVQVLAAGTSLLLLGALPLNFDPLPEDVTRIEGHARNFALLALLLALGGRLAALGSTRWRYALGALLVSVIVWPTIAGTARSVGAAIGNGIEVTNAPTGLKWFEGRFSVAGGPSDRIAAYIRDKTAPGTGVFSPTPYRMTFATGRSNASGFVGHVHLGRHRGPEYLDTLRFLEPAAIQRRGFQYIHAPDAWVESLPYEAAERLSDPSLFELLVREESESLYRVLPGFLSLDTPPAPGSYEALRRAVPASATVLLPRAFKTTNDTFYAAAALSHARLFGVLSPGKLHLRTPWQVEPLGDDVPNLVVTPARLVPWMLPADSRQPIWWNDETTVYALGGAVDQIMAPPPRTEPLPFTVRVSDVSEAEGSISFTATFDDRAPDQWTSQDWVLIATDTPPWNLSKQVLPNGSTAIAMWFVSYLNPGEGTTSLTHEFDFRAPSLAVRREHGVLKPLKQSEGILDSGSYVLAVRLRHEYKPEHRHDVAIIPVLRITVSETGEVWYEVHEEAGGAATPVE